MGALLRRGTVKNGVDFDAVTCAADLAYPFENMEVRFVRRDPPGVPTGWWRGVGPTRSVFVVESFIDELAAAAQQDPVRYRRALLKDPRMRAVLDLAADRAGWGTALPAGSGRGVSIQYAFGSYLAQVAEVSVSAKGEPRVERVVCAMDCGQAVNPDTVRAQLEGGVMFGLSAALGNEITIANGRVQQSNFNDFPALRMSEAPRVEAHLVASGESPGGVGETGTACVAAALCNAIYAATGKRVRTLPVSRGLHSLSNGWLVAKVPHGQTTLSKTWGERMRRIHAPGPFGAGCSRHGALRGAGTARRRPRREPGTAAGAGGAKPRAAFCRKSPSPPRAARRVSARYRSA